MKESFVFKMLKIFVACVLTLKGGVDMIGALNQKRITASEVTSSLIKAVLKMSANEIISLLNYLEREDPENNIEPRMDYCAEVTFSVEEKFYSGYIVNINSNGVMIETNDVFVLGQKLTLSFQLPNYSEYVKLTGKIIRIAKEGVDILFDERIDRLLHNDNLLNFGLEN